MHDQLSVEVLHHCDQTILVWEHFYIKFLISGTTFVVKINFINKLEATVDLWRA